MALTSKQISDRESEVTRLEGELAAATVKADSLRAFTDFRAVQQSRTDHARQPRAEPLRLGARAERAGPGDPLRRLAAEADRHRQPGRAARGGRRDPGTLHRPRPRSGDRRLRAPTRTPSPASSPRSRTSTASPASGSHRLRRATRSRAGETSARAPRRREGRGLPHPRLHLPVRDRRRLRRRADPRDRDGLARRPGSRGTAPAGQPASARHRRHHRRADRGRAAGHQRWFREAEVKATDRAVLSGLFLVVLLAALLLPGARAQAPGGEQARRRTSPRSRPRSPSRSRRSPSPRRPARSSPSTTAAWSCSARRCPSRPTRPRCWSSSTRSPNAPTSSSAAWRWPRAAASPPARPRGRARRPGGARRRRSRRGRARRGRAGGGRQPSTDATSTPTTAATAPAPATESAAANLPIGATVGPAGLPDAALQLRLRRRLLRRRRLHRPASTTLVHARDDGTEVDVNGRLITVDGFSLLGGSPGSDPDARGAVRRHQLHGPLRAGPDPGRQPRRAGRAAARPRPRPHRPAR